MRVTLRVGEVVIQIKEREKSQKERKKIFRKFSFVAFLVFTSWALFPNSVALAFSVASM